MLKEFLFQHNNFGHSIKNIERDSGPITARRPILCTRIILCNAITRSHSQISQTPVIPTAMNSIASMTFQSRQESPIIDFKCEDCGREFSNRDSAILHRKQHNNEKTHFCTQCSKEFFKASCLQVNHKYVIVLLY